LLDIIGGLIEVPLVLRTFRRYSKAELRRSLNQHQDLISALAAGDADWAAAVMRAHILSARKSAERSIEKP
jgi:DNA-binding GntR family transcriptional regulator